MSVHAIGQIIACRTANLESLFEQPASRNPVVSVLADDDYDAEPTFSEDYSIGEVHGSLRWNSKLYVASFRETIVDVENGIVGFAANRLWGDSTAVTLNGPHGLTRSPDMFLLNGRYGRLEIQEPVSVTEGPVMLAHHWACRTNYGHWLMNSLLSVFLMRKELIAGKLKLLFPVLGGERRRQILRMGVPPEAIIETEGRYVHCSHLLYPSPLTTNANGTPHALIREFFDFLKQNFPPPENLERPSRIDITRLGYRTEQLFRARRMTNERELIGALRLLGFTVLAPHELDFASQIHVLANAQIVIGQFGAALWNVSFAPKGSWLIEIATHNWISNEYLYAAHLARQRFSRIMIEPAVVEPSTENPNDFDFAAPIEKIVSIVQSIDSAEGAVGTHLTT